jgi:thioester reductase-like protein
MQTKCVAEHMMFLARNKGIPTPIYRLGAITGHSQTGVCNPKDFTYSSLRAAVQLGIADHLNTNMLLTPVDYVAQAVVALSRKPESLGRVFHVTNPRPSFWFDLVQALCDRGYSVRFVSFKECVETIAHATRRGIKNPMSVFLPILLQRAPGSSDYVWEDYYKPVTYDCTNTLEGLSGTGITCPPPDDRLLDVYLGYLVRKGMLPPPEEAPAAPESRAPQSSTRAA